MEKQINIYARILMIFGVVLAMSFLTEQCHDLLGDWHCSGTGNKVVGSQHFERCNYLDMGYFHNPQWHYGFRHYVVIVMGSVLFVFQSINLGIYITKKQRNGK